MSFSAVGVGGVHHNKESWKEDYFEKTALNMQLRFEPFSSVAICALLCLRRKIWLMSRDFLINFIRDRNVWLICGKHVIVCPFTQVYLSLLY